MPSEETTESVSLSVPGDLAAWLRRSADERGVDAETYARELLAAQRAVDEGALEDVAGIEAPDADGLPGTGVDSDALDDRLEELQAEYAELLEDVRSRVVQVKRETDAKAPAEHDHPALTAELSELRSDLDALETGLDSCTEAVESLESDVERGFENYEEVLEYLVDATDDLSERVERVARATLSTREQVQELSGSLAERERADALKRDAALEGISTAVCEECGHGLDPALLTAPRCPACEATFADVEPKRGFFGTATLVTGDAPAFTDGEDDTSDDLEAALTDDRPHPGEVDWESTGDRS